MASYVQQGVDEEGPVRRLEEGGVGWVMTLGAERGRAVGPEVVLAICGGHGGDPEAIAFIRECGFTYVSCSPFRVPVARLAAAQCAIAAKIKN